MTWGTLAGGSPVRSTNPTNFREERNYPWINHKKAAVHAQEHTPQPGVIGKILPKKERRNGMDWKQIFGILLNALQAVPEGVKNSFFAFVEMLRNLFR